MSKMSELSLLIDNLITAGETLAETGRALKDFYSQTGESAPAAAKAPAPKKDAPAPKPEPEAPAAPAYTKEDVRGILAKKANESGGKFKTQVKTLVRKYASGGSLTDVPAESYPTLIAEVEGLADA